MVVGGVAGCSSAPVEVVTPTPSAAAAARCRTLDPLLPRTLDGRKRRDATPRSAFTTTWRAWGEPAVVLRCGVPRPVGLRPTSQLFAVNDVDWYVEEHDDDSWTATTVGRVAYVEVQLPPDVTAGPLADLAGALKRAIPTAARGGG